MLFAGLVLAILLVAWIAYRLANREAFVARGALSPPPSEQITFAGSTPAHPFHLEAGNVLLRTVFRTAAPANSQVEVRDIVLPPRAKSQLSALPGVTLLEVYAGEAILLRNETSERLHPGTMRSVLGGEVLAINNLGTYPVVLRLYVFEAK